MEGFWHKIEVFVDRIIPIAILVLLVVIILELVFHEQVEPYHIYIELADGIVIFIFVIDLIFKYIKVKDIPNFIRYYWLDILVVFPFFLIFRLAEGLGAILRLGEAVGEAQVILHEGLEIEKEGTRIIREIERGGKLSRSRLALRFLRPILRSPRLLKVISVFQKPKR